MRGRAGALALLLALGACGQFTTPTPGPTTTESYADYTRVLSASGRLRLDPAPRDAPYDNRDLARNFVRIALAVEDLGAQKAQMRPIRRWEQPIRYRVLGDSATPGDRAAIADVMGRLSAASTRAIDEVEDEVNFLILILDARERASLAELARRERRPFLAGVAELLASDDSVNPCLGLFYTSPQSDMRAATVLVKDETRGRLRRACFEEELSQTMGLTNDDPRVRPSLFNDDQEFAVLTEHDARLLAMLYHPALHPGMQADEVVPLLPRVIAETAP